MKSTALIHNVEGHQAKNPNCSRGELNEKDADIPNLNIFKEYSWLPEPLQALCLVRKYDNSTFYDSKNAFRLDATYEVVGGELINILMKNESVAKCCAFLYVINSKKILVD